MGNNSSKWDREAHYAAKTTKELEALRGRYIEHLKKHDHAFVRVELEHIRMLIGERVGRKH